MIDMVREADRRVGHAEAGAAAQTCAGSAQASATARVPAASGEPAEGPGEALSADRSAFLDRLG